MILKKKKSIIEVSEAVISDPKLDDIIYNLESVKSSALENTINHRGNIDLLLEKKNDIDVMILITQ